MPSEAEDSQGSDVMEAPIAAPAPKVCMQPVQNSLTAAFMAEEAIDYCGLRHPAQQILGIDE